MIGLFIQLATEDVSVLLLRRLDEADFFFVEDFALEVATSNPEELPLSCSNATQSDEATMISGIKEDLFCALFISLVAQGVW